MTEADFIVAHPGGGPPGGVVVPAGSTHPARVSLAPTFGARSAGDLRSLLHRRLRYISLGCVVALGYFAALVVFNPLHKVGFSLHDQLIVGFNWAALAVCAAVAAVLWWRPATPVGRLRLAEAVLFGVMLAEMGLSLFSDLFLDRELVQPLADGDHALFHYASSWALPFFALIVCYGTLVPSGWRHCTLAVAVMAAVPLAIGAAAGSWEGAFTRSFTQSFLAPLALWMTAAVAVAVYGAHRLEALRQEVSTARQLGQYRLTRRLGAGGMGEVYLAEHVLLRRPCAVKVIRPGLAGDPAALRRFEHEVRATATLTHPNTVQVYDYGLAEDGTFYYAMEYLPGLTLEELVRRDGPLPGDRAVRLLRQVCGALREAHGIGLIHRDLKPSNVIVCDRGGVPDVAKLLDFGLARRPGQEGDGLTRPGVVAGTPAYMSPEQAAGRDDLDPRSDIYSLGAVTYFLLTGRPPFVCTTALATLKAHRRDPVVPPARLRPGVPDRLQAVVLRCLTKDPAARFPDAASLEAALAECASIPSS